MAIDVKAFRKLNIADTCAVWNLLSSNLLFHAAVNAGCEFSCTAFVLYECLSKPRTKVRNSDGELQGRLRKARQNGHFKTYHLSLDDLLEIEILENRRNLGKGELSSMAFAKATGQSFFTDDQKARKLASTYLTTATTQTTPHLFGWLIYSSLLGDSDKDVVIAEHKSLDGPLEPYFVEAYNVACMSRLIC
jgi:hypothetical protein